MPTSRRPIPLIRLALALAGAASATAAGHPASLAVDRDGNVYVATASSDAAGRIRKWDKDGNAVPSAAAIPIRAGVPSALCADEEYLYCAVSAWNREPFNNRQQIRRFRLKDGHLAPFTGRSQTSPQGAPEPGRPRAGKGPASALLDGHIQVYEWPELLIPKTAPEADRRLMRAPLRALDVVGTTLYVADAIGGVVRMYDTDTGAARGEFGARLPLALAVDPVGHVWVADHGGSLRAYRTDGYAGVTYAGLREAAAMSFGPGATLFIADTHAAQVLTPNDSPDRPGDFKPAFERRAPAPLNALGGVAADASGNLVTLQHEPGAAAAKLARWSRDGTLLWHRSTARFVCRFGWYPVYEFDTP